MASILDDLKNEIKKLEEILANPTIDTQQSSDISIKIELYKKKIEDMVMKRSQGRLTGGMSEKAIIASPPKSKTETSRTRKEVNFKLIF